MANRQGEAEWFKGLTEGELCDLLKAYGKSHDQAMREKAKIKFSLTSYRGSEQAQAGTRLEGRKRLMSEGVYIRFAQTEEGGDLTKYQAEKKWNEMLKDPSVFKVEEDDKPKCAVLVHQDLVDYEDLSRTCQMNREQKLARMSEEQFNAKAECCISESRMLWFLSKGFDLAESLVLTGRESNKRMASAVEANASAVFSGCSDDRPSFMLDNVRDLAKKPRRAETEEAGTGEESDAEKKKEKSTGWFDTAQQSAKASRMFDETVQKYQGKIQAQLSAMKVQIDLSRGCGGDKVKTEILICSSRMECLEQISQGSPASFTQYCLGIRQKAKDCCSVNSHGSASEVAVGVLGSPCNNHESLHTMAQFKDMNSLFAKVATADELASNWKRVKTVTCHWDELLASCRVSLQELKKADKSGAPKAAPKKRGGGKKQKDVAAPYQVFEIADSMGSSCETIPTGEELPEGHPANRPFVFTGPSSLSEVTGPSREGMSEEQKHAADCLREFKISFGKSDLRTVAGKAQLPCGQQCEQYVRCELFKLVAKSSGANFGSVWQAGNVTRAKYPALKQLMVSSCYGVINGHRSVRFESGAMATLRFGCQSHRRVVLVSAQLVLDFLREEAARSEDGGDGGSISHASAVAWLTHAGQEALDGFTSAHPGQIWFGDVMQNQTLYVPAGMVFAEAIGANGDCLGFKTHIILEKDEHGHRVLQAMQMDSKDQGKRSPPMDELLLFLAEREAQAEEPKEKGQQLIHEAPKVQEPEQAGEAVEEAKPSEEKPELEQAKEAKPSEEKPELEQAKEAKPSEEKPKPAEADKAKEAKPSEEKPKPAEERPKPAELDKEAKASEEKPKAAELEQVKEAKPSEEKPRGAELEQAKEAKPSEEKPQLAELEQAKEALSEEKPKPAELEQAKEAKPSEEKPRAAELEQAKEAKPSEEKPKLAELEQAKEGSSEEKPKPAELEQAKEAPSEEKPKPAAKAKEAKLSEEKQKPAELQQAAKAKEAKLSEEKPKPAELQQAANKEAKLSEAKEAKPSEEKAKRAEPAAKPKALPKQAAPKAKKL
ncbi:unnamed protein product [Effrenium voratum]|nr:unnamed protein product [Effrenium voratum]